MVNYENIKTRFAPSPTGNLHIGNIRTALYSWLFARSKKGKFLLRIENSDVKRSTDNFIKKIITDLNWLNIDWDEGPYFQTDRFDRYNSVINQMIQQGVAYKCYCSVKRLEGLRKAQLENREKPKYDGYCRFSQRNSDIRNNSTCLNKFSYVVRFSNPRDGVVVFHDQIRGMIVFKNKELDDVIIRRSDGSPTYNFCVVIDDMDMNITHVIRGEEHINNTPRQINILRALNAPVPVYAHVSMILGIDKKKLSKRTGVLGVSQYRYAGFLPESILNYLIRLGWSYENKEIFSIDQMKNCFNFNGMSKSASIFNFEKLLSINHYYIRNLPADYIASHLLWYMNQLKIDIGDGPRLIDLVRLFAQRSNTLKVMAESCLCFYKDFDLSKNLLVKVYLNSTAIILLSLLEKEIDQIISWDLITIKLVITKIVNAMNVNLSQIGGVIRVALLGVDTSPPLSDVIYIMGQHRVLSRIHRAICYIRNISFV